MIIAGGGGGGGGGGAVQTSHVWPLQHSSLTAHTKRVLQGLRRDVVDCQNSLESPPGRHTEPKIQEPFLNHVGICIILGCLFHTGVLWPIVSGHITIMRL